MSVRSVREEGLRESVNRLEQALSAERTRRDEAEALLAGIRCVAEAPSLAATDEALLSGLQPLLHYQSGVVLARGDDDAYVATASTSEQLTRLRWPPGPLLGRVLAGQPVAVYDVRRSDELAPLAALAGVRSALCMPLVTAWRSAVLVGVHAEPAFFSPRHVALARGFARTAAQMLANQAAKERVHDSHLAAERAAMLEQSNAQLREQLETIQDQQQQIQRLSAPVLQISRQVLAVPIVGDLGETSLANLTESLLHALTERRARFAILDLTGLTTVDLVVTERLRTMIRAVEMVGARCLVTGVSPQVAAEMTDAGHPTLGAAAYASLADGLRAALAALGERR
jgi:anti-anti-sigma regulatory factor